MDRRRWSLIFFAVCLALAFSVSSVEAGNEKGKNKCTDGIDNDGDGLTDGADPDCGSEDPPPPADFPIIAVVGNNFGGGGAAAFITTELLGGIYTNVSVKNFNRWTADDLRRRFDVVHFFYQSPPSIEAPWSKLEAFMLLGGGILWEDPSQNIEEIDDAEMEDLGLIDVEPHVPGDDPAVVVFELGSLTMALYDEPGEILSAFTAPQGGNGSGYFGDGSDCLASDFLGTGTTFGLGFGCFVNNHITWGNPGFGLVPFLRLGGDVVGVYGEFTDPGPPSVTGRIVFNGPDHGFHAGNSNSFQANHFCALTNEIIWLSQLDPTVDSSDAKRAVDDCVVNAGTYLNPPE